MIINNLKIKDFRNIESMELAFDENINVVYGENAQGKTNILEAIYLFSGSKSFRRSKDIEMVRIGSTGGKGSFLTADFSTKYDNYCGEVNVKTGRTSMLNGVILKSINQLGDKFPAVVFSPRDLNLVKDGPEERRRFLDNGLFQIKSSYGELSKRYKHILEQRNAMLKNIRNSMDWQENLEIWDTSLAALGAKIIYQRDRYIENIMEYSCTFFSGLVNEKENEGLSIEMIKTVPGEYKNINDIEQAMIKQLFESRSKDISGGFTSVGPHRDDMNIRINGLSVKTYGSQGQQRSCVLAIKMGEAFVLSNVYEDAPIVLLDDVLSELDQRRQDYILNNIDMFQVFITCCDANSVLRLKKGKTFHISEGCIFNEQ